MSEHSKERIVTLVGIDLAKRSFHVYGADAQGQQVVSKKLTRSRSSAVVAKLPACTVRWRPAAVRITGPDVSHLWPRGAPDRPAFVKPYVKSNKNDAAMPRPSARPPSARTCAS